jgi:tRNA nucleotidyltransferase (CCA-adding enzyme)
MNAIAREIGTSNLIDPFDGQRAIAERSIKTVGSAINRFREDRLRVFRAIRFSCQLGFTLDFQTCQGISYWLANDFDSVSAERIQVELCKAFQANNKRAWQELSRFPYLFDVMESKGIWLKPSLEQK